MQLIPDETDGPSLNDDGLEEYGEEGEEEDDEDYNGEDDEDDEDLAMGALTPQGEAGYVREHQM